jgi:glycosyltransferase involved in cell wall biosynthesis
MATYGGIERHVCMLAEEAIERKHQVRFLTTSNSLNDAARQRLLSRGVDFRELPQARDKTSTAAKILWLARETLAAKFGQWDLIYTNGQSALAAVVWRAGGRHTRIVHHHHTAADASEQKTWSKSFRNVLSQAPEVVGCSVATCENIATSNGRREIRFLPYFTACPVNQAEVKDYSYRPRQELNFGFIGRLVETKGIGTLCELSRHPDLASVVWHIYGAGPDYPESFFKTYPTIRYHGAYRDLAHYGEILRNLDAVVLFTKHNEGMPLSLIESMSAGLPWVASDKGGTRELASSLENCAVISDPNDQNEVRARTVSIIDRLYAGKTSRVAQRAIYDQRFAPQRVAEQWFAYFEKTRTPERP